jgi:TRAP-type mannitol/chloroaromatic compound transport system substrate-binding protein
MSNRRRFLANAGGAIAATAAILTRAPNVIAQPKIQWRMSTAYPPVLDQLQGAAQRLAEIVEETSGGRFKVTVFAGGQIMQRSSVSMRHRREPSRRLWLLPPRTGRRRNPPSSGSWVFRSA